MGPGEQCHVKVGPRIGACCGKKGLRPSSTGRGLGVLGFRFGFEMCCGLNSHPAMGNSKMKSLQGDGLGMYLELKG